MDGPKGETTAKDTVPAHWCPPAAGCGGSRAASLSVLGPLLLPKPQMDQLLMQPPGSYEETQMTDMPASG